MARPDHLRGRLRADDARDLDRLPPALHAPVVRDLQASATASPCSARWPCRDRSSAGSPTTASTTASPTERATRTRRTPASRPGSGARSPASGTRTWAGSSATSAARSGRSTRRTCSPTAAWSSSRAGSRPGLRPRCSLPFAAGWLWGGTIGAGLQAMFWGGLIRIFLLHHITWSVNSVCHFVGTRRFRVKDESRNVWWSCGSRSASRGTTTTTRSPRRPSGLRPWELDIGGLVIRLMRRLGLVWKVNVPTPEMQHAAASSLSRTRWRTGNPGRLAADPRRRDVVACLRQADDSRARSRRSRVSVRPGPAGRRRTRAARRLRRRSARRARLRLVHLTAVPPPVGRAGGALRPPRGRGRVLHRLHQGGPSRGRVGARRQPARGDRARGSDLARGARRGSRCVRGAARTRIPVLVDDVDDAVALAYGGWPDRLYLIGRDGRVAFQGERGPDGFKPGAAGRSSRAGLNDSRVLAPLPDGRSRSGRRRAPMRRATRMCRRRRRGTP